ncbi:hypothetical protein HZ326_0495 [Fusarium oxysporum f. sp. albedinis]|nr:hypothetical protein HZ326_0495 [Fusarium oxysporum f. sp. albedinis]
MSGRESIGVTESHSSPQGQVTPSSSFLTQILDPSRTSNTPRSQLKHRGWHVNAVQRGINMDHGYGMEERHRNLLSRCYPTCKTSSSNRTGSSPSS